jgi:hypothetical protein
VPMRNKIIALLFLIIIGLLFSCQDQALMKKQLYNLDNIIIEEDIALLEEQYTFSLNFIAPQTASNYRIILAYPHISQSEEITQSDFISIMNSLVGFSAELYAIDNNELIHAILVTESDNPHIDKKTVSLPLCDKISLAANNNYELRLTIPSRKKTKDRYIRSVLVIGTPPSD